MCVYHDLSVCKKLVGVGLVVMRDCYMNKRKGVVKRKGNVRKTQGKRILWRIEQKKTLPFQHEDGTVKCSSSIKIKKSAPVVYAGHSPIPENI